MWQLGATGWEVGVMGILYFIHRNARLVLVAAVVGAALGAAGAIGWITAPIG